MADEARILFEDPALAINHETWALFLARYRRDCARFAKSAQKDKSMKERSMRAMSESQALLAKVDKLLR